MYFNYYVLKTNHKNYYIMCGIFALIGNKQTEINSDTRNYYLELSKRDLKIL